MSVYRNGMFRSYERRFTRNVNYIKRYVEVDDVLCTRETDKALLCVINKEECWVPKSQIDMQNSDVKKEDDEGVLLVSEWFAHKIGVYEILPDSRSN